VGETSRPPHTVKGHDLQSEAEVKRNWTVETPPEGETSLLELAIVIARRRRMIAVATIGLAFAGLIVSLLLPKRYTAITSILPPQQATAGSALLSQLGSLSSLAGAGGGSIGLKNPSDLQVALLKSATVETAMVDRFNLMSEYHAKLKSDALKRLEKYVDIEDGKDGLIRISVSDRDPVRAATMANAYIEEFRRATANLAVTEASQRRFFFEQQLSHAKDNLANAEEALKKTEQTTGLIQVESQARAVVQSVAQIRGQIAAKEVQIRGLRLFAAGDNPDLQLAEEELAGLRAEQVKMGAVADGEANALPISKGNMQQFSLEYVRKLRDVKYYETIFDLLARQYEVAKVDEARQGTTIQVVDRATVPDKKTSPKRALIVAGAAAAGLILSTIWAFVSEGWIRIENNPRERVRIETLRALIARKRERPLTSRPS
jgi:uncharacterized protein involved in exopolysaccharide biosynthesis